MKRLAIFAIVMLVARAGAQRENGWELRIPERLELLPGASGTLQVAIAIDRGLTISKDAGLILDLAPDTGVTVKRRRLGRADAVDPDADGPRFSIAVHCDAPGDYALKVHLRFWLCGNKVCRPIETRRTVAISVAQPPAPPPTPDAGVDAPTDGPARHRPK